MFGTKLDKNLKRYIEGNDKCYKGNSMILRTKMHINVAGVRDPKFKKELTRAAEYYLGTLMSKRIMNHISVDIIVKPQHQMDNNADGYCEVDGYNTSNKPRAFIIEVARNKSKRYMMMTLAHEIVHLKQYALGELDENMSVWKGKRFNTSSTSYWRTPWEIEAFGRERGMYTEYCQEYGVRFETTKQERDN